MNLDWDRIRKRRLMLASPLYGGLMCFGFHRACSNLMQLCLKNRVHYGEKFILNDSLVPRARNRIAAHFLDSDATDLLLVDSDITFTAEDALSLLQYDDPVVGGIYSRKQVDWLRIRRAAQAGIEADKLPSFGTVPVLNWLGPLTDVKLDSLFPVKHLGTGFLRLRREVFEAMISRYGDDIAFDYSGDEPAFGGRVGYDFFPVGIDDRFPLGSGKRQYLSEDWFACERAAECGFTINAAPWVRLIHTGNYDYPHDLSVMDESLEEDGLSVQDSRVEVIP